MNAETIIALVLASPAGMTAPEVAAALGLTVAGDETLCDGSEVDEIDGILCAAVSAHVITARKVAFADAWARYGTATALGIDTFAPTVRLST